MLYGQMHVPLCGARWLTPGMKVGKPSPVSTERQVECGETRFLSAKPAARNDDARGPFARLSAGRVRGYLPIKTIGSPEQILRARTSSC